MKAKHKLNTDQENVEKKLRKHLAKHLLVEPDSRYGTELIDSLVNLFKRRHLKPKVRLVGDRYFVKHITPLLSAWDIQTLADRDEFDENQDFEDLYVPGPQERDVDIPAVVSYIIQGFVEPLKDRMDEQGFSNCPGGICGNTVLMLIGNKLWPDFDYMRQFLERAIMHDWSETGGYIEAFKAIKLSKDVFARFVETDDERYPTSDDLREWFPPSPPKRDQVADVVGFTTILQNRFLGVGHVSDYLFVTASFPDSRSFVFRLCAIKQVMDNVYALYSCIPGQTEYDEGTSKLVGRILDERRRLAARKQKFTKEDEIQALKNAGICDPGDYDDLMAKNHCSFFFEKPDTTYDDWKATKKSLGIHKASQVIEDLPEGTYPAAIEKTEKQKETGVILKNSGRLIECRHGNLDFTPNQAKVVSVHYEKYLKDNDYLCEQDVLEQVDLSTKTYDNIFKSRRDHFKKLFENHRKQKDLWRFRTDL